MKRKSAVRANPFYVLLVIVGFTFVVTACAYGVMAFTDVAISASGEQVAAQGVNGFMNRHGMVALFTQVALLGLLSVAAMGTDQYWQRLDQRKADQQGAEDNAELRTSATEQRESNRPRPDTVRQ